MWPRRIGSLFLSSAIPVSSFQAVCNALQSQRHPRVLSRTRWGPALLETFLQWCSSIKHAIMPRAQVSSRLRHVVFEGGHSESESGSSLSLRVSQPLLLSSDSSTGIREDFQQDLESLGPWMWCTCSLSRELDLNIIPLSSDWHQQNYKLFFRSFSLL